MFRVQMLIFQVYQLFPSPSLNILHFIIHTVFHPIIHIPHYNQTIPSRRCNIMIPWQPFPTSKSSCTAETFDWTLCAAVFYALKNSSISLSSLCSVTRPPCFTPSQNSFARIFLCVSNGISRRRSQMRRLASVGPVPRLIRWSSNVSWTWSRNCWTSSECFRLMSAGKTTHTHAHLCTHIHQLSTISLVLWKYFLDCMAL